jgi:hypothetical protein
MRLSLAVVLINVFGASPLSAQEPWPISLDASLGASFGTTSGIYRSSGYGIFADLTLAAQLGAESTGGVVAALSASGQGQITYEQDCVGRPDYVGCVPYFPAFATIALTAGYETRGGSLRFLAGPARVSEEGDAALGWTGRVDVAALFLWRFSAVASVRGIYVPSFRDDRFRVGSFSAGIRLR